MDLKKSVLSLGACLVFGACSTAQQASVAERDPASQASQRGRLIVPIPECLQAMRALAEEKADERAALFSGQFLKKYSDGDRDYVEVRRAFRKLVDSGLELQEDAPFYPVGAEVVLNVDWQMARGKVLRTTPKSLFLSVDGSEVKIPRDRITTVSILSWGDALAGKVDPSKHEVVIRSDARARDYFDKKIDSLAENGIQPKRESLDRHPEWLLGTEVALTIQGGDVAFIRGKVTRVFPDHWMVQVGEKDFIADKQHIFDFVILGR